MKAGENFQLTESWWKAGKPAVLTDTGLSNALRAFGVAEQKFLAGKNLQTYGAVVKALAAVDKARIDTIAKCGSNPLLKDTKAALAKNGVIKQRQTNLNTVVTNFIEPEVKRIETKLVAENTSAAKYAASAASLATKLAAAQNKKDNADEVKRIGKEIGRQATDASLELLAPVFEDANVAKTSFSGVAKEFPKHVARLNAVVAGSKANVAKFKLIIQLAKDNDDIAKMG